MKILVTGGTGLVGSSLVKKLKSANHVVFAPTRASLNLLDSAATLDYIKMNKPDAIIDAAAIVGGIGANISQPLKFISENLRIQSNLMDSSIEAGIKNFVFLGSSCIYPKFAQQPIKEDFLMTGPLEETNSAYAVAKIAGVEVCRSVRKQLKFNWFSVMPTNVYGPGDNFNLENSHVIPGLIRKFVDAAEQGYKTVELWGDGEPLREFIFVDDLSDAILLAMKSNLSFDLLNIGSGQEISIRNLAELIKNETGFKGEINWNKSIPNGTPKKLLDSTKIRSLGWAPSTQLLSGLRITIDWYKENSTIGKVRI